MLLRNDVAAIAFNLVNYNVNIATEPPSSNTLLVNKELVDRLRQLACHVLRSEYSVDFST